MRKPETIAFWRGRLPHWEVVDGRYFVTMHLHGAIPKQGQNRIHAIAAELEKLPPDAQDRRLQFQRRIFAEMEAWLDRAEFADQLRNPDVAAMVVEAIRFREERDWHVFEYVVMPSHLHLFFEIVKSNPKSDEAKLKSLLEQFKRWTGHEAAQILSLDEGRFWQDEWFDHWSRSDEEDEKICAYIRRNPEKAGLVAHFQNWPYGSWNK